MNTAIFAGRLGRDAELRATPSGKSVLNFSLAVDIGFGDKKETLWVDCSMWGERADKIAPYLTKGKSITAGGDVGLRQWESQGKSGAAITLNVQRLTLQGGGEAKAAIPAPADAPAASAQRQIDPFDDAEIPF